ncbi:hypothetical protein [Vibrio sp. 10N.261.55.A7]|nr:hypothetical protein [Vibrio sp. 10N.261.55.A7]
MRLVHIGFRKTFFWEGGENEGIAFNIKIWNVANALSEIDLEQPVRTPYC